MGIEVRSYEDADWSGVADLMLMPGVRWGTLQMPMQSRDALRERFAQHRPDLHRLVAVEDDLIAGMLGLHVQEGRRAHAGSLGMAVRDDLVGRGIGGALVVAAIDLAENWLNLRRLELTVYTDNDAAIGLYKKHGFAIEGTAPAFAFRDGGFVDAHYMARLSGI